MSRQAASHSMLRHLGAASVASATAAFVLFGTPSQVAAADLSGDLSVDSGIEMTMQAGEGPVGVIEISLSTKLGKTTLVVSTDGKATEAAVSTEECMELWQYLLERDIGNMGDAPAGPPIMDEVLFIFTFRNRSESNSFSAYAVDFLTDTRYREIARGILAVADKYGR